jgi:glycosyltransferase involved in cell wall biosynthesis
MLSVLIPVKNWDPSQLVNDLHGQLTAAGKPFEILVSEDGSPNGSTAWSEEIGRLSGVAYYCQENPLGRSANRNFLASMASQDYLLFIDGDAAVAHPDYIKDYLDAARPGTVICGGTLYTDARPADPSHLLRWTYGRKREQTGADARQRNQWKSFSTFNFLLPASVFAGIRFDESVTGYGHEDTLFGIRLHEEGIPVVHLDNGLYHIGLEPASQYLQKVRESGANLVRLYRSGCLPDHDAVDMSLLRAWNRLTRMRLRKPYSLLYRMCRKAWERNLSGPRPSIFLLDLYKLGSISISSGADNQRTK